MKRFPDDPGHRALRKGRHSCPGQVYLITTVTFNRQPVFHHFAAARALVKSIYDADRLGKTETLAYVVMPDHLHWLVRLSGDTSLSMTIGGVKGVSAYRVASLLAGMKLWSKGFHDHAVRREEDLKALARYVIYNPVRAGLVDRPGLYPHWDAQWL
jgi:putative transposase